MRWRVIQVFRQYTFNQQQPGVVDHRLPAVRENLAAAIVIPVVQDALQNVRIGAGGNRLKEVTGDDIRSDRRVAIARNAMRAR